MLDLTRLYQAVRGLPQSDPEVVEILPLLPELQALSRSIRRT